MPTSSTWHEKMQASTKKLLQGPRASPSSEETPTILQYLFPAAVRYTLEGRVRSANRSMTGRTDVPRNKIGIGTWRKISSYGRAPFWYPRHVLSNAKAQRFSFFGATGGKVVPSPPE